MSKQENLAQLEKHLKKCGKLIMRLKYQLKPRWKENTENGVTVSIIILIMKVIFFGKDVTFSLACYTHTNYFQIWDEPVKFLISCTYLKTSGVGF